MLTDFQNSFTVGLASKFAARLELVCRYAIACETQKMKHSKTLTYYSSHNNTGSLFILTKSGS